MRHRCPSTKISRSVSLHDGKHYFRLDPPGKTLQICRQPKKWSTDQKTLKNQRPIAGIFTKWRASSFPATGASDLPPPTSVRTSLPLSRHRRLSLFLFLSLSTAIPTKSAGKQYYRCMYLHVICQLISTFLHRSTLKWCHELCSPQCYLPN